MTALLWVAGAFGAAWFIDGFVRAAVRDWRSDDGEFRAQVRSLLRGEEDPEDKAK